MDKTTTADIADPKSGDVLIKKGKRLTPVLIGKMKRAGVESVTGAATDLVGRVVAHDILDPESGEVLAQCNEMLAEDKIALLAGEGHQGTGPALHRRGQCQPLSAEHLSGG